MLLPISMVPINCEGICTKRDKTLEEKLALFFLSISIFSLLALTKAISSPENKAENTSVSNIKKRCVNIKPGVLFAGKDKKKQSDRKIQIYSNIHFDGKLPMHTFLFSRSL